MLWVGTCGFGRRQSEAFRGLDLVEVQQTFYRPVSTALARRWREAAPPTFGFAVKASQFITHEASSPTYRRSGRRIPPTEAAAYGGFRDSPAVREGWEATRTVADILRARAILFQCPATFRATEANVAALYRFFGSVETSAVKVWEPRGPWASHLVAKVCEDLSLVHAVDPFAAEPATYGLAYFRLHGRPPGTATYRYTYTDADLERLRAICGEYDDAFVLFNNVTMHADAVRLRGLAGAPRSGESGLRLIDE